MAWKGVGTKRCMGRRGEARERESRGRRSIIGRTNGVSEALLLVALIAGLDHDGLAAREAPRENDDDLATLEAVRGREGRRFWVRASGGARAVKSQRSTYIPIFVLLTLRVRVRPFGRLPLRRKCRGARGCAGGTSFGSPTNGLGRTPTLSKLERCPSSPQRRCRAEVLHAAVLHLCSSAQGWRTFLPWWGASLGSAAPSPCSKAGWR